MLTLLFCGLFCFVLFFCLFFSFVEEIDGRKLSYDYRLQYYQ